MAPRRTKWPCTILGMAGTRGRPARFKRPRRPRSSIVQGHSAAAEMLQPRDFRGHCGGNTGSFDPICIQCSFSRVRCRHAVRPAAASRGTYAPRTRGRVYAAGRRPRCAGDCRRLGPYRGRQIVVRVSGRTDRRATFRPARRRGSGRPLPRRRLRRTPLPRRTGGRGDDPANARRSRLPGRTVARVARPARGRSDCRGRAATLAQARTERTAAILLDQYHGALRRALDESRRI